MIEWQDCPLLQTSVEIVLLLHQVNSDVSSYGDNSDVSSYGDNNVSLSGDNDSRNNYDRWVETITKSNLSSFSIKCCLSSFSIKCCVSGQSMFLQSRSRGICFHIIYIDKMENPIWRLSHLEIVLFLIQLLFLSSFSRFVFLLFLVACTQLWPALSVRHA